MISCDFLNHWPENQKQQIQVFVGKTQVVHDSILSTQFKSATPASYKSWEALAICQA